MLLLFPAAVLLYLFLLFPGRSAKDGAKPFAGRYFAHRGLYEPDQSVPENSLAAFRRAVEAGYGIELDLQRTRDGEIVVFHDDFLKRMCSVSGRPCDYTLSELREFRLSGTGERIPLLREVLSLVGGRVPLIVELKRGPENRLLCESSAAILDGYRGAYCIESFDPFVVRWFRRRRPRVLRGQLACSARSYGSAASKAVAALASRCLLNWISRPQFIAYENVPKPPSVRLAERLGALPVCWTSREPESGRGSAIVIFEFWRPPVSFTVWSGCKSV